MGCRSTPSPPEWRRWRSTAPRLRSRSSAAALPRPRWAQNDAARALGLRPALIMALVVVPQVFRIVLPPLADPYASVRNSSVARNDRREMIEDDGVRRFLTTTNGDSRRHER